MRGLLGALVVGCMGMGLVLLAMRNRSKLVKWTAIVSSSTMAGLSLLLLPQVNAGPSVSLDWIPNVEPASLQMGTPSIYLAVMVFFSLPLAIVWSPERAPPAGTTNCWPGVAHLLCGLIAAALTLDQFLARYVVLELVALCVILVFLVEVLSARKHFPLWHRYLQFRLGDAGLMLAILVLALSTGTFLIKEMVAAASSFPFGQQIPIALGGLVAASVKMGLPPFHGWLLDTRMLSWQSRTWLSGVALPVLGAYLLYALGPLFPAPSILRDLLIIVGVLVLLWVLIRIRKSSQPSVRVQLALIGHGAIALVLAGTPGMVLYLLTFIPLRVVFCLVTRYSRADRTSVVSQGRVDPLGPDTWLLTLGQYAEFIEERGLGAANRSLATVIMRASGVNALLIENRILEGINRGLVRAALHIGRTLQVRHTGRLRRNVLWAVCGVVALMVVVLVVLPRWEG